MKWIELEWDSKKIKVPAQKLKGYLWFHLDGETRAVEMSSGRRKNSAGGGSATGEIKAPMPGKILKVFVAKEDQVKRGQPVVVMEAMKMEYTLEADQDGAVKEMNVSVGDQVALGQLLVNIEGEKV